MTDKITIWLDSGANIYSQNKITGTHEEVLGISSAEWDLLTESQKNEIVFETLMNQGEWGWTEE
jgi:hypothetical protein